MCFLLRQEADRLLADANYSYRAERELRKRAEDRLNVVEGELLAERRKRDTKGNEGERPGDQRIAKLESDSEVELCKHPAHQYIDGYYHHKEPGISVCGFMCPEFATCQRAHRGIGDPEIAPRPNYRQAS